MKFTIALVLTILVLSQRGYSQTRPMIVGQDIPDLVIKDLYNTDLKQLDFKSLRGKIVLIDFWSTYCGSCLTLMEKLGPLQQKFKDSFVVVPVNYQSRSIIEKFWKKNHITQASKLMTTTDDKILTALFPHQAEPYEVWIDKEGKYLGTTDPEFVNEGFIDSLVKDKTPRWVTYQLKKAYDFSVKLINSEKDDVYPQYGILKRMLPNMYGDKKVVVDSVNKIITGTFINCSILGLYSVILKGYPQFETRRRILLNVNLKRLKYNNSYGYLTDWEKGNLYSYEFQFKLDSSLNVEKAYLKMTNDLDSYFNLKSSLITRECNYMEVVKDPSLKNSVVRNNHTIQMTLRSFLGFSVSEQGLPILTTRIMDSDKTLIYYDSRKTATLKNLSEELLLNGYRLDARRGPLQFLEVNENK